MYALAGRKGDEWRWSSKASMAAALAVLAVGTRLVVAFVLGSGSEYVDDLTGVGLVLPLVVVLASLAVMESFDRGRSSLTEAFRVSLALVVVQHLLWIVYMYRLFP
jgi:hypothetical protein